MLNPDFSCGLTKKLDKYMSHFTRRRHFTQPFSPHAIFSFRSLFLILYGYLFTMIVFIFLHIAFKLKKPFLRHYAGLLLWIIIDHFLSRVRVLAVINLYILHKLLHNKHNIHNLSCRHIIA